MRIGLIDMDGHNFINLPLAKLSAWHKQQGDDVSWYEPLYGGWYDRVYISKVFTFTPDYQYPINADETPVIIILTAAWSCHRKSSISILTMIYMGYRIPPTAF